MKFEPKNLDFTLSPYTGLTREHWIEAGSYLLKGIFENLSSPDAPVVLPRKETVVTYPHADSTKGCRRAEYFEGLARSFFIASPLIHIDSTRIIAGFNVRDYYKNQVLRACTPGDPNSVMGYDELMATEGNGDEYRTFQQTVETSALVICLWTCKEEIWGTYTKAEKDIIAAFLDKYAHGNTVPQNWRLFNMLDMAFLNMNGYPIDKDIMRDHAETILGYYAGDGWYRDGHSFDYYSAWAFNVYTAFWNLWYGYEYEPYIAKRFEENSNKLMETYADFFDRDGFTNMWGRSNVYRNAATSAFEGNLMMRHSTADPGLARRISSGSLLQFFTRDDFLYRGIPTLGFYGQFPPLVQGYSCAESPYWLGKAFLCLHLPANHPFWTATETNGSWMHLGKTSIKVTTLNGPALSFSNHGGSGETILRTGKVAEAPGDEHGMWNYAKLSFNSKYPWESAPSPLVEAQQYVLENSASGMKGTVEKPNVTQWQGERDDVLYRRQFFNPLDAKQNSWLQAINLADFPVPFGLIRADKLRLSRRPVSITLGAYGFPDNGTKVTRYEQNGAKAIVLKGRDHTGREKQLAMTIYDGWDSLELLHSRGTNPDSPESIVVYARLTRQKQYGYDPYILISQVITKESLDEFTEDELFPIRLIRYTDPEARGGYGPTTITLKNGQNKTIDFDGIEGCLEC